MKWHRNPADLFKIFFLVEMFSTLAHKTISGTHGNDFLMNYTPRQLNQPTDVSTKLLANNDLMPSKPLKKYKIGRPRNATTHICLYTEFEFNWAILPFWHLHESFNFSNVGIDCSAWKLFWEHDRFVCQNEYVCVAMNLHLYVDDWWMFLCVDVSHVCIRPLR